jgi:hypothetical protein
LATLKAEVERLRRELSKEHVTLEQQRRLVEQKNVVIQTLEDDKKRLLSERDEVIEKTAGEVRMKYGKIYIYKCFARKPRQRIQFQYKIHNHISLYFVLACRCPILERRRY